MFGQRVRRLRRDGGLSQAALAARAGVSRQLVGAVEAGRHLPRVDAAAALADALGVAVESLLAAPAAPCEGVVGSLPARGRPVQVGRVGDQLVGAALPADSQGWATAGGVVGDDGLELLPDARPRIVAVGCDPAIGLAARLMTELTPEPAMSVPASTAAACAALAHGRAHAAVVHGPPQQLPAPPLPVVAWHLSRWRVGLALPANAPRRWADALAGRAEVVQREAGAGSQAAFERAVAAAGGQRPGGPVAAGHIEAAWWSARTGRPAVTIEPAALASGVAFYPLEVHTAQWWTARAHADEPGIRRLGQVLASRGFQGRLAAIGGYDLADCAQPVTPACPSPAQPTT
jgi:DNA-binding XRE family transcriptional regulator